MSIRVLVGGRVEVVVPPWMRAGAVHQFVHRHRTWVERKVREFSLRHSPADNLIPEQIELAACGERWAVQRAGGTGRAALRCAANDTLILTGDVRSAGDMSRLAQRWLLERARTVLVPWLARVASEAGLKYRHIQIRRQRTRWGSCSPAGTISLNCCLLFQSPAVVRYLLLHELCHTRHMNHSRRFWRLVERFEPDYGRLDRTLTQGWQNVPGWVFAP
jgi:predicted metal-dependent hydrolase